MMIENVLLPTHTQAEVREGAADFNSLYFYSDILLLILLSEAPDMGCNGWRWGVFLNI